MVTIITMSMVTLRTYRRKGDVRAMGGEVPLGRRLSQVWSLWSHCRDRPGPFPLSPTLKCSQACKSSHHWEEVELGLLDPPLDAQSTALPSFQGSAYHSGDQSMMCVLLKKKMRFWEHRACSWSGKHTPEAKLGLWKAELPLS